MGLKVGLPHAALLQDQGRLARVEICNQSVAGSTPVASSIEIKKLGKHTNLSAVLFPKATDYLLTHGLKKEGWTGYRTAKRSALPIHFLVNSPCCGAGE